MINLHNLLIQILIAVMAINIALPYIFKEKTRAIKFTRIGFFTFWAIWAMVIFVGLVIFAFMKMKLTIPIILMLITSIILAFLDGYRAIKLSKIWRSGELGVKFNTLILILEIIITALTVVAIVKLK